MKRVKWKQRFLIIGMAIAMLVNGIPLYAAEQSDNIPIVDDCAVPESNMLPDEIITEGNEFIAEETEDEDLEISSEIEDNVEELNAQYDLSVSITEVTRDTVKGVVNISQVPEEENAYIIVKFSTDKMGEEIQTRIQIEENKTSYEVEVGDLFADTEYMVEARLHKDYYTILETTETQSFYTEKNPMEFVVIPIVSEITQNSAVVTVNLSEDTIAWLEENGISTLHATIQYGIKRDYTSAQYVELSRYDNYSATVTLENLCAGAEYNLDVLLKFYGTYGKTLTHQEFITLAPDITYSFDVEGNTVGTGFVKFAMEGYEEGKEYILEIYVSKNGETKTYFERAYLNSQNGYAFQSRRTIFEEIGCIYTITAEVKDASTYQRLFLVEGKTVEIPLTKIFKVMVLEDSITYTTAKVNVEWIDTDAISDDEIEIYVQPDYETGIYSTLNKENKREVNLQLTNLKVGKEQNVSLSVKLNGIWNTIETFQITTKAHEFEKLTEVKFPTQLEIARRWKALNVSLTQKDTYEKSVNHNDGGILSKKTLQNALNLTNFIRYVAGLPDDVVYDEEWCRICNCGSELNRMHGELNHHPSKPSSVTKEFYDRGYLGTSSSNLAMGSSNLADSILLYMIDPGESNYAKGHRTWILQPYLGVVGFGKSQSYYSMYVTEGQYGFCNREGEFSEGYYYWPAHNMPMELYTDNYWDKHGPSLYLSGKYDSMEAENITLQVKSKKRGKTWTLRGNQGTYESGLYMRVYEKYLVFDTGLYPKGDEVTVTVKGTTINGEDAPIVYTMNFFSLKDIDVDAVPVENVKISSNISEIDEGESTRIEATILPENAGNKQVNWTVESVDGKGKATITQEGILTAILEGEVKVTATSKADNSISDSLILTIKEKYIPLEKISFAKESIRMEKGSNYCLLARLLPEDTTENHIIYISSDASKVMVKDGIITAMDVTEEPVVIRASVGDIYAECYIEVYEEISETPDRYYSTRITQVLVEGETTLTVGGELLIKVYPVTNGYELEPEEFEIIPTCKEKKIKIEPVESSDLGYWYRICGMKPGDEKITFTINSKFAESEKVESVKKQVTFKVLKSKVENAEDNSLVPVLVSNSLTINQNLETGTKIDIRLKEGNTQIEKIYLTSKKQDDSEKLFTIIEKDSNYYLQTKEICKNKKYNLVLHIETALGVWEYPIKVTTKQSFPKITVKQVKKPNIQLLYEDAVFVITGKEDILGVDYTTSSVDFIKGDVSGNNKEYQLTLKQKEHGKKIDKKGSVFILFEGYRIPLEKKITITTTNKKIKADTLVASGNKVVLNGTSSTELSAGVYVKLENSVKAYPDKIFVSGTNKKSAILLLDKEIRFTYNKNTGKLQATIKEGVKAGNYSFTYTGMVLKEENYVATEGKGKLAVSISQNQPSVKLKVSGSIDLINRSQSCIIYTPTFKAVNGKAVAAELTGEQAKYFYAKVTQEGKIQLFARTNAKIVPKQNYELGIKITLNSGYEFSEQIIKVKPKQSTFKAVAKENRITLCKNESTVYQMEFLVKSPKTAEISYVKPVALPDGFVYDVGRQTIRIQDNEKLKNGKTYNLSFEVTPKGAYRSLKPAKVTVKVKVMN